MPIGVACAGFEAASPNSNANAVDRCPVFAINRRDGRDDACGATRNCGGMNIFLMVGLGLAFAPWSASAADPISLLLPGITVGMDRLGPRALDPPLRSLDSPLSFCLVQAKLIDTSI